MGWRIFTILDLFAAACLISYCAYLVIIGFKARISSKTENTEVSAETQQGVNPPTNILRIRIMYCSSCGTQLPEKVMACPTCKGSSVLGVSEAKDGLRKTILDAYYNEYKDLSDTWRTMETKAQGGITVAGIFLAAVFAYLEKLNPTLTRFDKVLLVFAIALLVLTVFLAVKSLMIREVPSPPLGLCCDHYGTRLLSVKNDLEFIERVDLFFYDVVGEWRHYVERALVDYRHKASYLYPAQILLLLSAVIVAVLTIGKTVR